MQFFYIDYMNNGKKERNIGFLRVENNGLSVGLRGVPMQCGERCKVYAVNLYNEKILMGEVPIKSGYGMEKLRWNDKMNFEQCMMVEIPLYGNRKGVCVLRECPDSGPVKKRQTEGTDNSTREKQNVQAVAFDTNVSSNGQSAQNTKIKTELCGTSNPQSVHKPECEDIYEEILEDKWQQLLKMYPQVHICPEAQCILIRPKDAVILTTKYHELATNSFVLHAYYNYRQLLLFRYAQNSVRYYLGVPGVYYEREQRIAQMFGFEGFENGEARMQQDADRKVYQGCFGYYMKRVEI